MITFGACPRCRRRQINPYLCQCRLFLCWFEDQGPDEAVELYAQNKADAAETLARRWYQAEFRAETVSVWVKQVDGGGLSVFIVEARVEVTFRARDAAETGQEVAT